MVTFRDVHPFPVEHMRLIGEICILWTYVEHTVLQAVCESANIAKEPGQYLGLSVPFGTRIEMLNAVADTLKGHEKGKDISKEMNRHLEALRAAYLLRNKYAHADLLTAGSDKDPYINTTRVTKKVEMNTRPLPLSELEGDCATIYAAYAAFLAFMNRFEICKKSWF